MLFGSIALVRERESILSKSEQKYREVLIYLFIYLFMFSFHREYWFLKINFVMILLWLLPFA